VVVAELEVVAVTAVVRLAAIEAFGNTAGERIFASSHCLPKDVAVKPRMLGQKPSEAVVVTAPASGIALVVGTAS